MPPKRASFAPAQASLNEYFSQGVSMPSIRTSKRSLKTESENLSTPSLSKARKRKEVEDVATVMTTKRRRILTMANVVEKGNTGLLTPPETVRPKKTIIRRRSNMRSSSPAIPDTPTFKNPLATIHASTFVHPRTPSPRRQRYTKRDVIASSETPEQLNRVWPSDVTNDGGYDAAEDIVPSSQTQLDRLDVIPSSQTQAHFTSPESPVRARGGYHLNMWKGSSPPHRAITRTSSKPNLGDFEIPATQLSDWVVPCSQTERTTGVQLADEFNMPSTWQSNLAPWPPVASKPDLGFDIPSSQPIGEVVPSSQIDSQDLSAGWDFEIPGTQYERAVSPRLKSVLPTKDLETPLAQQTPLLITSLPPDSTSECPNFSQAILTAEQVGEEYSCKQLLSSLSSVHEPEHPTTTTNNHRETHTTLEPSQHEFPSSPTEPDTDDDFDLTVSRNNVLENPESQALDSMHKPETQVKKLTHSEDRLAPSSSSPSDSLISKSVHPAVQDFFEMLDENRDFSMGGTLESDFFHSSYATTSQPVLLQP